MNYDNRGMYRMPECRYPVEYHNRYGYMYPYMDTEFEGTMAYPMMYPDIYYKIYPYACRVLDRMDNPYVPYPSEAQVESMVNECYDTCVREMPELEEYADLKVPKESDVEAKQITYRRPILRDLITIILLSELFRRRRRFFPFYGGYRYGPYY